MKPWDHAKKSAHRFGGRPEDYILIHEFFDASKEHWADMRHRAILHNTFGIFLCEKVYGRTLVNTQGNTVHVRSVAEQHILDDLGFIPHVGKYLKHMALTDWMMGSRRAEVRAQRMRLDDSRDQEE
jgi:hypothetical protein